MDKIQILDKVDKLIKMYKDCDFLMFVSEN
jgi:hypothetical protein